MITKLSIRNFQSLYEVDLDLEPLTVIVGRSSSGKSALFRAIRTLVTNPRGSGFISHGHKVTLISADTSRGQVELVRSTKTADNGYVLFEPTAHADRDQQTFTKLNGEVPPEVTTFLGIAPKDPIQLASQFDRPFLLSDSAQEVARVLGALTNVSIIFDAAREANRQKLAAAATLRTRQGDLEAVKAKLPQIKALKAQMGALSRAEDSLDRSKKLAADIATIEQQRSALERAEEVIERTEPLANVVLPDLTAAQKIRVELRNLRSWATYLEEAQIIIDRSLPLTEAELPSMAAVETAQKSLSALTKAIEQAVSARDRLQRAAAAVKTISAEVDAAQTEYIEALHAAGTCPTCGQNTKELSHA